MTSATPTGDTTMFDLDADHTAFQQVCRDFVTDEMLPLRNDAERTATFPDKLWPLLARAGLLGLGHPAEYGGMGGDTLAIAILSEELAKASGGMAVTILVSAYMAASHFTKFGNPEQQARFLRPVIGGEQVAAIAVTEPGAGSDVAAIQTSARPVDGGYLLNGTKMFITNGAIADVVIVAAKTGSERHHGITMFCVPRGTPGFGVGRALSKVGWHSSDTRELVFEDCFVPDDAVLGTAGKGFHQIMAAFQMERISLAGMGIGLAQAAFDDALEYARTRRAFGATIGTYQSVRHRLSEMATLIAAARLLTYQAATRLDSSHPQAPDSVAMAKLFAARAANTVADDAVQIFGGYGFIEETPVAMHYRDARVLRIGGGTDEIQMEVLAKRLAL